MTGQTIAHYKVGEKIGAGGMGVVYQATDTKLNRQVALKILPEEFSKDAERMARFRREAQLLASLNHPHIASVFGFEEEGNIRALALELVEGPTLTEKIADGPLPLDEALRIARQMAEGLEAAHDRGIIHRDLKPANVKLTLDDSVKVLDFGLAKALEGEQSDEDMGNSPTLSVAATKAGIILGTAAYMAPEQAKGKSVDRRADIWSFGVVLYEMLTGTRAYTGDTISETLAAVLLKEPDWDALPEDTPAAIGKLLSRCLQKEPRRRLQAIGEARIALDEYKENSDASILMTAPLLPAEPTWKRYLPWGVAAGLGLVALVSLVGWLTSSGGGDNAPVRLRVQLDAKAEIFTGRGAGAVLSPDGKRIAYVATSEGGERQLYVRSLDQLDGTSLSGTREAIDPFFSPDGQWISFFTETELKKVSVFGGAPLKLCDVTNARGGTWSKNDIIVFAPDITAGLSWVPAEGGEPTPLTTPDSESNERSHRWPVFLPDGDTILFMAHQFDGTYDDGIIQAASLSSGEVKTIHPGGTYPRYAASGHLLFVRGGTLFAAPFDADRVETTGPPAPVLEGVQSSGQGHGGTQLDVSASGTLIYLTGTATGSSMVISWADTEGNFKPLQDSPAEYSDPRLSPDGKRLLYSLDDGTSDDIWVYDIERGIPTRLTFHDANDDAPFWHPDGEHILFTSSRNGEFGIYRKRADGAGEAEKLWESEHTMGATSISPDGKIVVVAVNRPETGWDTGIFRLKEGGASTGQSDDVEYLLQGPSTEVWGRISPDGRWLAYMSSESGRAEIYVRPFLGAEAKWQVSSDGGRTPVWSSDGRAIYYQNNGDLYATPVEVRGDSLQPGIPKELLSSSIPNLGAEYAYDVGSDGRIVVLLNANQNVDEERDTHLRFVLNWFTELERLGTRD